MVIAIGFRFLLWLSLSIVTHRWSSTLIHMIKAAANRKAKLKINAKLNVRLLLSSLSMTFNWMSHYAKRVLIANLTFRGDTKNTKKKREIKNIRALTIVLCVESLWAHLMSAKVMRDYFCSFSWSFVMGETSEIKSTKRQQKIIDEKSRFDGIAMKCNSTLFQWIKRCKNRFKYFFNSINPVMKIISIKDIPTFKSFYYYYFSTFVCCSNDNSNSTNNVNVSIPAR